MKQSIKTALVLLLFFYIIAAAGAQNQPAFPRLEPDPKALEYYALGQRSTGYSWRELAQISLWASGDLAASGMEKISAAVEKLLASPDLPSSGKEKAEFILNYMHKNILKSYSLYQTRMDTIFANGRFNCVSSAVLYMIFCRAAGINTSGVMTKEHAFITVHIEGQDIDVETTNQYGFDPGNRKEFLDSVGNVTGFAYVPAQNYRDRQTISQIELVSLILNNRIADHERQNRFADAVPVAIDMAALLAGSALSVNTANAPDSIFEDPHKSMMDRLFNYGAMLLKGGKEEDCLRWIAAASVPYPDKIRWQEFTLAAVNNYMTKLTKAGKFEQARTLLEEQKSSLENASYAQLEMMVIDSELLANANKIRNVSEGDAVVNAIVSARSSGIIAERRGEELLTFAIQKTASVLSASPARNWRAAANYIDASLARFGANRELEQALQTYRDNIATDYHNRFAAEWNKKNFGEAERVLNEGLAEFPNDRRLLADRETVNKNRR